MICKSIHGSLSAVCTAGIVNPVKSLDSALRIKGEENGTVYQHCAESCYGKCMLWFMYF